MINLRRICLLATLVHAGCGAWIERQAMKTTVSVMVRSKAAMQQESDVDLARAATPSGIKTLEGFYVAFPDNRALLALIAEAVCQYGAGFLQDDWEVAVLARDRAQAEYHRQRARKILARCINYGARLLGPTWERALWDDPETFARLIGQAEPRHVPGMLWVAMGLGTIIGMFPEDFALTARLPEVERLLDRVIALDERFLDGLPHMTLGILNSARSAAVGGDPERGRQYFERARAITGGRSLIVDVMFARYYAVITQDRALFRHTLIRVLRTAPAIWPENRLANEIAHRKARRYLDHESRWFAR